MKNRREFLGSLSVAATAGALWPEALLAESVVESSDRHGTLLPTRALGKTGERVTLLGLGGQHFQRLRGDDLDKAIELSIEGGIRFFDTANAYGQDSLSERLYGKFLTPKYRDEIYLMTKSAARDPKTAQKHLESSLRNMKTDVIDLWQVHTLEDLDDVNDRWENGTVDVFLKAQEEGKVRHLGFSGHKEPSTHLRFIEKARERGVEFQASQFPVNVCDPAYSSFIEKVIPACLENGIAILAMKTMCGGRLFGGVGEGWGPRGEKETETLVPDVIKFRDATDYVWSLPIATRIAGYDNLQQIEENIAAAKAIGSLTAEKQNQILKNAAGYGGPDREYYKRNLLANNDPLEKEF